MGCASFPRTPFGTQAASEDDHSEKKSHRTHKRTAHRDKKDSGDDEEETSIDKRLIVKDDDESPELDNSDPDQDVFKDPAKSRHTIKESDGLSKMFDKFIDPRTKEINRNLGYE